MELSFIRCASCRSLVPASAKTCRMCGAPIADDTEPTSKKLGSIESDAGAREVFQKAKSAASAPTQNPVSENPLSGFMRDDADFEEETEDLDDIEEEFSEEDQEDFGDENFDDQMFDDSSDDDDSDEYLDEDNEASEEYSYPGDDLDFPEFDEDLDEETEQFQSSGVQRESFEPSSAYGAPVAGQSSKQKTSLTKEQPSEEISVKSSRKDFRATDLSATPEPQPFENTAAATVRPDQRRVGRSRFEQFKPDESAPEAFKPEQTKPEAEKSLPGKPSYSSADRPVTRAKTQPEKPDLGASQSEPNSEVEIGKDGALRGWLVMLEDGGQSVELRTGKLLLTSSHIRDQNELVIEDPSVSVPHAMLHVGDSKIRVFDLVSEYGTSVERNGRLEKVDNFADLNDRDYLILGNVRLLVVLI